MIYTSVDVSKHTTVIMDKTIFITGSTSGIGREAAILFAKNGATVHIHGRDAEKANELQSTLQSIGSQTETYLCDFSDLEDVRSMGERVATEQSLDALVNNAGGYFRTDRREQEMNYTVLVNHFAPFVLTHELIETLSETGGQIINTASEAHRKIDKYHIYESFRTETNNMNTYCKSKLFNIQFTFYLHDMLRSYGVDNVSVNCFHPGIIPGSGFLRSLPNIVSKIGPYIGKLPGFTTTTQAAQNMLTVYEQDTESQYFKQNKISEPTELAQNRKRQEELWGATGEITKTNWHMKLREL